MTGDIIKFKNERMAKASKIRVSQSRTSPVLETTVAENLILRKFLNFVMKDIDHQIELFKKAHLPKEKLEENLYASNFLKEYFQILRNEVEKGLD